MAINLLARILNENRISKKKWRYNGALAAIQRLPSGVTLSFAPYGQKFQHYVNQPRAAGHEVLLGIPIDPKNYPTNDPGAHALLTRFTISQNLNRLDWLLSRFTNYKDMVNHVGGRFTSSERYLRPVLEVMQARGLMFLHSNSPSTSVVFKVAQRIGLHMAINDSVIDESASRVAIDAKLLALERLAQASGNAIGTGFPYPVTVERLAQWTNAIGVWVFDLVPISALKSQGKFN